MHVQDVCVNTKENYMSMKTVRQVQQITVNEIATRAAMGVARALNARQAAGLDLSYEELAHVNGGVSNTGPINGGVLCPGPIIIGAIGIPYGQNDFI